MTVCLMCSCNHGHILQLRGKDEAWPLTSAYVTSLLQTEESCPQAWTLTCVCMCVQARVVKTSLSKRGHIISIIIYHRGKHRPQRRQWTWCALFWLNNCWDQPQQMLPSRKHLSRTHYHMRVIKCSWDNEEVFFYQVIKGSKYLWLLLSWNY